MAGLWTSVMVSGLNHLAHSVGDFVSGKIDVYREKQLIKKLICRSIEEYANSLNPNLRNIIMDNIQKHSSNWTGTAFKRVVKLNGHRYNVFVDGMNSAVSTEITGVGFTRYLESKLLGGGGMTGRGGFYVTGQMGAQLVSISAPTGSSAYKYLRGLFTEYKKY